MMIPRSVYWVSSGILFALAFVFSFLWWFVIPACAILLCAIASERSFVRTFFFGWLVGTLQYAGAFFWVWSIFPILWLPDQSRLVQLSLIGIYWVLTSGAIGVGLGVFAVCVLLLMRRSYLMPLIPIVWVVSEVLRSYIFSVYSWGPGSTIDAAFTYGYIGYPLAEQKWLLQLASLGGVYALSLVVALLGTLLYIYVSKKLYKRKQLTAGIIAAVIIVLVIPAIPFHMHHTLGKKIIAVETYFDPQHSQQEGWEAIKDAELKTAVGQALQQQPDAIVLPEDSDMAKVFPHSSDLYAWARAQSNGHNTVIVDNAPGVDKRGVNVIRSHMYDTQQKTAYNFDKKYLVPQGEFLSYLHEGILSLMLPQSSIDNIKEFMRFEDGIEGDNVSYPAYLPGILACFEAMVPWGVHDALKDRHPGFVVHQVSHSWFNNPFSLEYELDSMLKVHAVWNNVPIVSAANMADSKEYVPDGSIREGRVLTTTRWWELKEFDL